MRYGISAGAVIVQDQRVLLVRHYVPDEFDFWVPPGGKLEGDESIFACAERETFEETGLRVRAERIVYVQEFVAPDYHFCKFFLLCHIIDGELTLARRVAEETFLSDACFLSQPDLEARTVFPEVLRTQFWDDLAAGFPETRYLGLQYVAE